MANKPKEIIQERVPAKVYRLHIQSANEPGLQLIRAVLLNLGFKQEELIDSAGKGNVAIELFDESPAKLQRIKKLFDKLKLPGIKAHQRSLTPQDWLTRWKTQWRPAALTKNLDVVPVWWQDKYRKPRAGDYLLMDTLLSFGTGLHETTRFMAQFIEDKRGSFKSFLDIGTGTGILALVALKYGAKEVVGIDIGALSVQAALDNMKANQLYFKVTQADIAKYKPRQTFDFVAANLVTEDLMAHGTRMVALVKKGGFLAISGISLENLARLKKAFASLPLKALQISKGKQWSGILFQKKIS